MINEFHRNSIRRLALQRAESVRKSSIIVPNILLVASDDEDILNLQKVLGRTPSSEEIELFEDDVKKELRAQIYGGKR
jgi:hypothetical protein